MTIRSGTHHHVSQDKNTDKIAKNKNEKHGNK